MDAIDKILKELHLPNSPDYSSLDYWNKRYARNDDRFEWLQQYSTLRPFLLKILHGKLELVKVIYLGCGTSTLANSLINDGLKDIECVDFSDVLIRKLKNSPLCYQYMDVTEKWDYKNESVDLLIDKGLMDTIMCGEGFYERLNQYFAEAHRVLRNKGILFIVSQGHPETRLMYLTRFSIQIHELTKVKIEKLNDDSQHYLYICTK